MRAGLPFIRRRPLWFIPAIAFMCCVGVQLAATAAVPPLRTGFDVRVDRISAHDLLTMSPRALVDPARQRVAQTVTDLRQGLFFVWAAAQIAMFGWLWRSGRAARLRDFLKRRIRSRLGFRAAFGASLGLAAPLAGLPFAFVAYRVGFNVGLTEEVIGNWLLDYLLNSLTVAALAAATVAVVLEFVDRTRLWYLAFLALLFAASIEFVAIRPIVIVPLTTRLTPLANVAAAPLEMAHVSERTRTITAATEGIGRFTRIVLGDVLVAVVTPGEFSYVIHHENAHVRHDDNLKITLFATTLFVFAAAVAVLLSDRIGFRRDDDAVSRLALVGALLGVTSLLLLPLFNAYSRGIEYRADEDARHDLADASGAVRFLVRRADHDLIPLCNRRSSSWFFADHPALGSRIAEMRGSEDPCPHSPATR